MHYVFIKHICSNLRIQRILNKSGSALIIRRWRN